MSAPGEKMARVHTTEGRARRRLSTLRCCWGYDGGEAKRPPRVTICAMDVPSTWRLVDGDTDKDPLYELEMEA